MYNLIKTVIGNGGYKLSDTQYKAKKLYLMGDITEEQLDEVLRLASEGVNPSAERPEVLEMLKSLSDRIEAIEKRLDSGNTEPDTEEYEEWTPWDGISDKYQHGAIVSHNGKVWISEYAGQNVWEPGAVGTDALWREYTA
jgi:hypothetical protein